MTDDDALQPVQVVIAAGADAAAWAEVIAAAVGPWVAAQPLDMAETVIVAVPAVELARDPAGAPHLLAGLLTRDHRLVRIVAPSRTIGGSLLSTRQTVRWASTPVSAAAEWLDRASIMAALATPSPLVFVNTFTVRRRRDPASPVIGAWTRFAHPRQRLAASATDQRAGITAEIASAFHPALILLVSVDIDRPLAIASDDQIAVELVARALQDLHRPSGDDDEALRVGPWENPLIQRATELGMGVTWPGALRLRTIWTGNRDDPGHATFAALAEEVRARLGVPHPVGMHFAKA
ncbi:MAG TPA: hypothetical protein VFL82_17010 [Thermomicrobiales bacterium]|nr:hypothetical protein [Thermomicrobiales bacterium]